MKMESVVVSALLGVMAVGAAAPTRAQLSSNAEVIVSGLAGPRGLKFGPDGLLYVAEAGFGGTIATTSKTCAQVPAPIGPYLGGSTARISKIDASGNRTTVADGLPSTIDSNKPVPDYMGVADIAFLDGKLYALTAGGGCSHGNVSVPNGIFEVNTQSGKWKMTANLSTFLQAHPAAYPDAADFEPDGSFYSLKTMLGRLVAVEPNHGQIFSIWPTGQIKEEIDISQSEGHIVPTTVLARDGSLLVGNLGLFPITPNATKILTLRPIWLPGPVPGLDPLAEEGQLTVTGSRAGFATTTAIEVGPDGLLYVLEMSPAAGYPAPGTGKVVRLNSKGVIEDVATGLSVPTGMTFGPDGYLYVSNFGAAPPGAGQILRISVN